MRRLAGILLTVATIATVVFTFAPGEAGANHRVGRRPAAATATDRHLCESFDHLIRFLRHAPKPTALRSAEGRRVLAALDQGQPARVAAELHTMVWTFGRMRDGLAVTKAQDRAASDAILRASIYAARVCRQKSVQRFASAMISARIGRAEASSSTTTTPAP